MTSLFIFVSAKYSMVWKIPQYCHLFNCRWTLQKMPLKALLYMSFSTYVQEFLLGVLTLILCRSTLILGTGWHTFWLVNVPDSLVVSLLPPNIGFPVGSVIKNLSANAGDMGSILVSGRSPEGRQNNPLQYSCLGNPMDRGMWQNIVHGVTKSQKWLSD